MKHLLLLAFIGSVLLGFAGCQPPPGVPERTPVEQPPAWYPPNLPSEDGMIFGTGTAIKKESALAQMTAVARARSDIAFAVEVRIATMLRDFMQESGVGEDAQALEFSESVSKHVASITLKGCKVDSLEFRSSGRVYALVSYPITVVRQEALAEASRQEALYNEFKAKQAFEDLERAIQEME